MLKHPGGLLTCPRADEFLVSQQALPLQLLVPSPRVQGWAAKKDDGWFYQHWHQTHIYQITRKDKKRTITRTSASG